MHSLKHTLFYIFILLSITSISSADKFPARSDFKTVPYITLNDLYEKKDKLVIVDARSNYEYSILHIENAVNIPLSDLDFSSQIQELYNKNKGKKSIVFYCNGHDCVKSYHAVLKAKRLAKITDTLAFDGGIFDWTRRYPKHSVLLNKPISNSNKLISMKEFQAHLLKPRAFLDKADDNCIILDIRDSSQRSDRIFAGYEHAVNLADTSQLDKYLAEAKISNKNICIYDAVGKQIRWIQYYFKKNKVKKYYFLEGGAKAFYDTPHKELYDN